jgi:hypothetical protein
VDIVLFGLRQVGKNTLLLLKSNPQPARSAPVGGRIAFC